MSQARLAAIWPNGDKEGYDLLEKAQGIQSPHLFTRVKRFATKLLEDSPDSQVAKVFHDEVKSIGGEKS